MNCKNCKFFITENLTPSRKSEAGEGWGFCSCAAIKTFNDSWHSANESNPARDSIFTTNTGIGFLSEELRLQGVFGQFVVGENFGCIHFKPKL